MELFLIRHAQSTNNANPVEERVEDPPLTELGREQAQLLAEWIPSLRLTRLFTSPFLRTLQTTAAIEPAAGLTPEVRTDLHELGGCFSGHSAVGMVGRPGMTHLEINNEFPSFKFDSDVDHRGWWQSRPHEIRKFAHLRAGKLLARTREEFAETDDRVAYVMHGDFKMLFLNHIHEEPLETPYNVSVSKVSLTQDDIRLDEYNGVGHLPQRLRTC